MRLRIGRKDFEPSLENLKWGVLALGRVHQRIAIHEKGMGFVEARWVTPIGIVLSYKLSPDTPAYVDDQLFVSYHQTLAVFRGFAARDSEWQNLVRWKPKDTFNWKFFVRKALLASRVIGLLSFAFLLLGFWGEIVFSVLGRDLTSVRQSVAGTLLLVLGFSLLVNVYPELRYWAERQQTERTSTYLLLATGLVALILGVVFHLIN